MPELPEVETIVRAFRRRLTGRTITRFESRWARQASPSVAGVCDGITGRRIESVGRRGKFIQIQLADGGWLFIHLRMSGRFEWLEPGQSEPDHVRALWDLDVPQRLAFCDARKFGRIIFSANGDGPPGTIGIEPFSSAFTPKRLIQILKKRQRRLKPLLLDQSLIAGLGNIYTDEALFRAGLHPLRISDRVTPREAQLLHAAIRNVLREGIRRNGASVDWVYPGGDMQNHFKVYGRDGKACVTCRAIIEYLKVGQRGTHVCPSCQPITNGTSRSLRPRRSSHGSKSRSATRSSKT